MGTPLRVLIVEDSEDDTLLVVRELRRGGYEPTFERVDTPEAMNAALEQQTWDIVLCDYAMPRFSMPAALAMVKEKGLDLPFIIVSRAIGEEAAVAAMRAGAHDYVMKDNLARLAPAVERELREAEVRHERKQMEEALSQAAAQWQDTFDAIEDLVTIIDKEFRVVRANRAMRTAFPGAKVLGMHCYELLHGTERPIPNCPCDQTFCSGAVTHHELCEQHLNGHLFDASAYPINDKDGTVQLVVHVFRDITERKRAEEELIRLSNAVKMSTDSIVISDLEQKIVDVNEATLKMYGTKDRSDLLGKNPLDFIAPEDRERVLPGTRELIEKGYTKVLEYHIITKDGSRLPVEMNSALMRDAKGEPMGFVGVTRDVTERKRVEEALRESEEKFRSLLENASDAILLGDFKGNLLEVNRKAEEMTGYTEEELRNMDMSQVHPKEEFDRYFASFQKCVTEGYGVFNNALVLRKDGTTVPVDITGSVIEYGGKKVVQAILRDITERKQAEEALRKSKEMLSRYLESSPDAVYVNDLKATFLYGNRAAEAMIGYPREELIGRSFLELNLLPPEYLSKAAQNLELNAAGRPTGPDEFELMRKDGSRVFVEISTYPTGKGGKTEVIGIARDITERKRMEHQLQLAGRLAAVGELAAGVAHELNNPLAAVQAFAQLINDRDDLDETMRSDVETIYREAQRASRITANLLSFARRHMPEKRPISINQVIEKTLELNAYRMRVNNIDLAMELDPDLPMTMADFHQMQQVFVNIINNAEQAMIEAHGRGKLCVKTQKAGKMIQIAFADDGPGISEENLKRIFDPFFTTKEVGGGTGLGLSICYGLVEEHGGHISARSKPGEGATFVVEIPIVSEDKHTAQETDSVQVQGSKTDAA